MPNKVGVKIGGSCLITLGSGSGQQTGDQVSYSTKLLQLLLNYLGTMKWKLGKLIGQAMHSLVLAVVSKTRDTVLIVHNIENSTFQFS